MSLVFTDRPGLRSAEIVEKVQSKIHKALHTMLGVNHADDHGRRAPDATCCYYCCVCLRCLHEVRARRACSCSVTLLL